MNAKHPLLAGAMSLAALAALSVTAPDAAAAPATDDYGYVGTAARCDATEVAVEFGRTDRALVAICVDRDGQLEYRGVRLSDQASVRIPAGQSADGTIVASNDGVTYAVTPTMLLVSEGDKVLYRDAWVEFRHPRFSGNSPTSAVSTTTVTPSSTAGH